MVRVERDREGVIDFARRNETVRGKEEECWTALAHELDRPLLGRLEVVARRRGHYDIVYFLRGVFDPERAFLRCAAISSGLRRCS